VIRGRPARRGWHAVLASAVLVGAALGCGRPVDGVASSAPAPSTPESPAELEELLVASVPSGLPRLPDDDVTPAAGEKAIEDVAAYADDPAHERRVLEGYGYRFGWERFWGVDGGALTSVFVHQLEQRAAAYAYAGDLAANDAAYYDGVLIENPAELPRGCWLLVIEEPRKHTGLSGPAAVSWCGHGVFSVSVTSVADSLAQAVREVRELLPRQLDRLPPR
jgi:hypothetical protein